MTFRITHRPASCFGAVITARRGTLRRAGAAALALGALGALAGCQAQAPTQTSYGTVPSSQPIALAAKRTTSQAGALGGSSQTQTFSAPGKQVLDKAIERYRINKGQKPGPVTRALADLNGDGQAELLAYFTGEGWCAETGCSLAVFTRGTLGYVPVSTTRRVKGPILLGERSSNGWLNLHVKTGGETYGTRYVTLRFSGRGYPGNAITQTPLPANVTPPGRVLIAATQTASAAPPTPSGNAPAGGAGAAAQTGGTQIP